MQWKLQMHEREAQQSGASVPALGGVLAPMVTPLRRPDALDHGACRALVEHLLAGGVHGLFLLGTSGEGPSLSGPVRAAFVEEIVHAVAGRVPVLVTCADPSQAEALAFARQSVRSGADVLVAVPPYYYPLDQRAMIAHYRAIADAVCRPVLLYNVPNHPHLSLTPESLAMLAEHPNIIGIKDSGGDWARFTELLEAVSHRPGFAVLIGPELQLPAAIRAGAVGAVCGGANLAPTWYVEAWDAARRRDEQRVRSLVQRFEAVDAGVYNASKQPSPLVPGLKQALAELGLCQATVVPPHRRLTDAERQTVRRTLQKLHLMDNAERSAQ